MEAGFDHHFVKPMEIDALEKLLEVTPSRCVKRPRNFLLVSCSRDAGVVTCGAVLLLWRIASFRSAAILWRLSTA